MSEQFLAEVPGVEHKNVAAELLKKTLNAHHSCAISTMQVVKALIKLAKDLDAATRHRT